MSSGKFDKVLYQTDLGNLVPIRIQPETALATFNSSLNGAVTGTASPGYPSAIISKSRRGIGIHPRLVTVTFEDANVPAGYKTGQSYRVPCLNTTTFDAATEAGAGVYLGKICKIVSKTPELIK